MDEAHTSVDGASDLALHAFVRELALEGGTLLDGGVGVLLPAPHALVRAQPELLRRALLALLTAAADQAQSDALLDLRVLRERDAWRFEVVDGAAVPHDDADSSLHRATPRLEACEAALKSVRAVAAAHGWSAGVELSPGDGPAFWLRVPQPL